MSIIMSWCQVLIFVSFQGPRDVAWTEKKVRLIRLAIITIYGVTSWSTVFLYEKGDLSFLLHI